MVRWQRFVCNAIMIPSSFYANLKIPCFVYVNSDMLHTAWIFLSYNVWSQCDISLISSSSTY